MGIERQDDSPIGRAFEFASEGVVKPMLHAAIAEPLNTMRVFGEVHAFDYKQADPYSAEWFAQNVSGGLGALVPYTLAGKAAGGLMREGGARFGISGGAARLLQSEKAAFMVGAFAYDGLKPLHEGETHFGNAVGGAAGFYVFGKGNEWSKNFNPVGKVFARAGAGFLGADAHSVVSTAISQHDVPTFEQLMQAGVSGASMNVVLPVVQDRITSKLTNNQISTERGAPIDRYLQARYGDPTRINPELSALLDRNPWARVKLDTNADIDPKHNVITVSTVYETPGAVAKGLEQLRTAASKPSLASDWTAFRETRLNQELAAHQTENRIDSALGLTERLAPDHMVQELPAWSAPGGVSYEYRWNQEFQQHQESGGRWKPGDKVTVQEPEALAKPEAAMSEPERLATGLVRDLQKAGFLAVFAGGSVRDLVMGGKPKDYDIATRATPDQVQELFESKGYRVVLTGKQFGVINVIMGANNEHTFEIASLRTDGNYSDGRRPDGVKYVNSLYEDAARRDLTINAMFRDPTTGKVFDFFGGQNDIVNRLIRTVGDPQKRFDEDRLRMMRVPRFASRYEGFRVDPDTERAVAANAERIGDVSFERIKEEVKGILTSRHPLTGLDFMMQTGLMRQVLPEVADLTGPKAMQDPTWHPEGLTWTHTRMVLSNLVGSRWETMFAGLLHDIGKPATQEIHPDGKITNYGHDHVGAEMAGKIARRFKLSNDERDHVVKLVDDHMKMHTVQDWRRARLVEFLGSKYFQDQVALQHADAVGTARPDGMSKSNRDWLMDQKSQVSETAAAKPIIDGKMLIDLGVKPGKQLGEIKNAAMDAQREGRFTDLESAQRWLSENYPQLAKPAGG